MSGDLKILEGYNNFAYKVYSRGAQGEDKNVIFSPLSLSIGLSLVLAGAKKSSESEIKHLLDYVHYSCSDIHKSNGKLIDKILQFKSLVDFKFSNKLYCKDGTKPEQSYLDVLKNTYKTSEVEAINFADNANAVKAINEWFERVLKTKLHKHVVPSQISSEHKMILANALYFKGNWFKKFDKTLTKLADFHLQDGTTVQVPMMQLTNRKFKYKSSAAGLSASVCEFPFIGEELSMSIILPNKNTTLAVVESELTPETLRDALEEYSFQVKVNVSVPQFRIEETSEYSDLLLNLDAPHLFNGIRCDFTNLAANGTSLHLSKVFNKLVVEVDEEGNEAAAASGTGFSSWKTASAIGAAPERFVCNRPFLFIIHDHEYRIPLVIGKYARPEPLH